MQRWVIIVMLVLMALPVPAPAEAGGMAIKDGIFHVYFREKDREAAEYTLETLRQARDEFAIMLPAGTDPVQVYIAHTMEDFARRAGGFSRLSVSGMARSEEGLILLKAPRLRRPGDDYTGTVRHEFVHLLLYRNSDTGSLPRWLNEGICMSLANEYYWNSIFRITRMFFEMRIIEYRHLDRAFLAPGNEMEFGDAYAQALSMTRYLRDRIGEKKFWAVVRGCRTLPFPDALRRYGGISPRDLWQGYKDAMWRIVMIGTLASGSFFTPIALLVIVVWIRKQFSNRRILRRWENEEAEAADCEVFSWDEVIEDPEAWKEN
jgi:hypothetical protein